ncbi:1-acyl-sn-glycerol-3-phosphate acyltransferase [Pendulispora rubella]|uniref:1-acyl-sn-glycerol-3-phosphate acyltransferase n=1 Tax=Pendulispora rubella TaxID=2741070 RepID=A0ABZ2KZP2_9BACT
MMTKRVFPPLRALLRTGYISLSVEGAEHVPRSGPAIYVGNHAGWFTMDTFLGAIALADNVGIDRLPWGAVQDELLRLPKIGRFFEAFGGFPASWLRTPELIPREMEVFSIYPEGTEGNCKSFLHAYRMRQWHTGFLRIALARGAPIVPVAIVGGEECLPVAWTLRFVKPILGTILPMPFTVLPLPSRWKFIFHEPIKLNASDLGDEREPVEIRKQRAHRMATKIRDRVQRTLDERTSGHMLARVSKLLLPATLSSVSASASRLGFGFGSASNGSV